MNEIIVLTCNELQEIIREAVNLVSHDLLAEIVKTRTPELMTKKQLAAYLQCSQSNINYLMNKDLPFVKVSEVPEYYRSQIDEWLNNKPSE